MLSLFFSSSPNGVQGSSDSSSVFYGGGGGFWLHTAASYGEVALVFTAFAGIFLAAAVFYTTRGRLKSPWSRRKRKHALLPQQWRSLFTPDGKLRDGGGKFLKKVRSGGVDPSIRSEVFPFLLGVYDLNSSKEERDGLRTQNSNADSECFNQGVDSPDSEDVVSARESLSSEERSPYVECSNRSIALLEGDAGLRQGTGPNSPAFDSESSDSESSEDPEVSNTFPSTDSRDENDLNTRPKEEESSPARTEVQSKPCDTENFPTWQRIIRLDAVRANGEWISHSSTQAAVLDERARRCAEAVGLKDYDHLEPSRIFHAARLSFMRKARHNFRLDEVGIRRQLNIVSKIIKCKDSHLYRHLEKLQAEDCFFVYRMVVVRGVSSGTARQGTLSKCQARHGTSTIGTEESGTARHAGTFDTSSGGALQKGINIRANDLPLGGNVGGSGAIRAGIGKSAWSRIRQRAPPTDDLLLYAVAASVLQRRKQIIEKYSSMDEILRECNSMAGHLDVWKLLDDAHDLVVNLHNKV
ncbi:Ypt/Rab-GAP domain of gyp1p superfamily protein [Actinidia rufa]|uniref:Ypt/Rab-GAP domain of gyp1p superfamily protein n=1 Tax=Actinidia rufa TaxID=165716 RepID=A0A7J0G6N8_9ERIC|nr:Ypt/Rab-GAP domain of gyp1p superfamily protein [Actinidia rufa]